MTLPAAIMVSHSLRDIEGFFQQMATVPGVELQVYHSCAAENRRVRYFYPIVNPWPIAVVETDEDQNAVAEIIAAILGPESLKGFADARRGNMEVLIRTPVTLHTLRRLHMALSSRPGAQAAATERFPYRFVGAMPAP